MSENPVGMNSWSEEEFRSRVERRAVDLGRSLRSVMRQAGLSEDYLKRPAQSGRRIDNLARIAVALDWSLAEVLGIEFAAPMLVLDVDILERALFVAIMAIGDNVPFGPEWRKVVARASARAYDLLIELAAAGFSTDGEAALEMIAATFRRAGGR